MPNKTEQLQIRVTRSQKRELKSLSERAGQTLSEYILGKALPDVYSNLQKLITHVANPEKRSYALSEISGVLEGLSDDALSNIPSIDEKISDHFVRAYVASMIHYTCSKRGIAPPAWIKTIAPLRDPFFGSNLASLKPYLMAVSPPEFKARNIFIDSSVGDRV